MIEICSLQSAFCALIIQSSVGERSETLRSIVLYIGISNDYYAAYSVLFDRFMSIIAFAAYAIPISLRLVWLMYCTQTALAKLLYSKRISFVRVDQL